MNFFDPEKRVAGQPQIASHYHPLIGAYDSGDADALEYHAIVMRLAGIDGIIADWYGRDDYLDWGEGTVIEPSVEFGYRDLEVVQRLRKRHVEPAFAPEPLDLRLPIRLFKLRKVQEAMRPSVAELNEIARLLIARSTKPAKSALDRLEKQAQYAPPGRLP
jgi:hypothetical protein